MFRLGKYLHALSEQQHALHGIFLQDLTGELLVARLQRFLLDVWEQSKFLTDQDRLSLRIAAGQSESIVEFSRRLDKDLCSAPSFFPEVAV